MTPCATVATPWSPDQDRLRATCFGGLLSASAVQQLGYSVEFAYVFFDRAEKKTLRSCLRKTIVFFLFTALELSLSSQTLTPRAISCCWLNCICNFNLAAFCWHLVQLQLAIPLLLNFCAYPSNLSILSPSFVHCCWSIVSAHCSFPLLVSAAGQLLLQITISFAGEFSCAYNLSKASQCPLTKNRFTISPTQQRLIARNGRHSGETPCTKR